MADAKAGEKFLERYIYFHKSLKKGFTVITLIISFTGILKWKQFEDYVSYAFLAIAILQLVILIQNQFLKSDKQVEDLIRLKIMYGKYYRKLERLWMEHQSDSMDEANVRNKYYSLQDQLQEPIERLDSELHIRGWDFIAKKATLDANKYLLKFK